MRRHERHGGALWATAHHEAGHAVAAFVLGVPLRRASIRSDGEFLGHVKRGGWNLGVPFRDTETGVPPRVQFKLQQNIVMLFAGFHAERRYTGRANRVGASHDYAHALHMGSAFIGDERELAAYLRWLNVKADLLVGNYWAEVQRLAKVIIAAETLSGQRLLKELRGAFTAAG